MEPPAVQPPTEESSPLASRSSTYGFAAALAILGSAVFVAATVLPYATSVGQAAHLVELGDPLKVWVWSAIQLWGTSLAIVVTAAMLIPNRGDTVLLAGLLIAFGVETTFLAVPSLGQVLVTDNVDPGAGSYLGVMSGLIVLSGGIVAYRAWKSTRVST